MDYQAKLSFYDEQLARASKGLDKARASRNSQLLALNVRQLFKLHLMVGLIHWRRRKDPTVDLKLAVSIVADAYSELSAWDASSVSSVSIPSSRATIIATLVEVPYDSMPISPQFPSPDEKLDWLLVSNPKSIDVVQPLIQQLRSTPRTALAGDTYDTYFRVLNAATPEALKAAVEKGEILFKQRDRDSFYSGAEPTEGGGPENSITVDYRLAYVLKVAHADVDSIHAWSWGRGRP